ncbi:hypothetical protein [Pseudomonas typographi]|uniref:hypothetical protein n=1 Tax=Pseudomonas typographi TaxID=2715964 RepID=UPI00168372F2|nr:hypothetical protein [Pseudomonas typographi]MBD1553597.1 hypothetical protein [Pseudomonas typographi]
MNNDNRERFAEAQRLNHAGIALRSIVLLLRKNLDEIDLPGGCGISVRNQYGLLLAAENLSEQIYTALEYQFDGVEVVAQEVDQ